MKQFIAYYNKQSKSLSTFRFPEKIDICAEINVDHVDVIFKDMQTKASFKVAVLDINKNLQSLCKKLLAINAHLLLETGLLKFILENLTDFNRSGKKIFVVENHSDYWQKFINMALSQLKKDYSESIEEDYRKHISQTKQN